MTDPSTLSVPADRNLEVDVVHTAARDGDRRHLLDDLHPADFHHYSALWVALQAAHQAQGLNTTTWAGLDDWAIQTLDSLYDQAALIGNPRRAAARLRDLTRQRALMAASAELYNTLGRHEDPTPELARIRELLDQAAA